MQKPSVMVHAVGISEMGRQRQEDFWDWLVSQSCQISQLSGSVTDPISDRPCAQEELAKANSLVFS